MKRKAKLTKIGGLLLAVVMLASALSACGTVPPADPTGPSEKNDPTNRDIIRM